MQKENTMRLRIFYLILVNILLFTVANAEVTQGPNPSKEGELRLVILASHTPEYIKEWMQTPSNHDVTIKRLTDTKPNQPITAAFLVTGFTPDANGNFRFNVSFSFIGPDDKEVFGEKNYARGKGKAPGKPTFVMADPALDIVLEQSDLAGAYKIIGVVVDEVSKKSARSEYNIMFTK
jgi:hypothetical protein